MNKWEALSNILDTCPEDCSKDCEECKFFESVESIKEEFYKTREEQRVLRIIKTHINRVAGVRGALDSEEKLTGPNEVVIDMNDLSDDDFNFLKTYFKENK